MHTGQKSFEYYKAAYIATFIIVRIVPAPLIRNGME
jgi:hypothetical protein